MLEIRSLDSEPCVGKGSWQVFASDSGLRGACFCHIPWQKHVVGLGWRAAAPRASEHVIASVNIYPRAILTTPGTPGYYISYSRVRRAVLQKPLRWAIV